MEKTTTNPLCASCSTEMFIKTIFGKQVYECPKCKRRVPTERGNT